MIDSVYKNAFKEVFEILQNTDIELVEKIPKTFIEFIQNNMNISKKIVKNKIKFKSLKGEKRVNNFY